MYKLLRFFVKVVQRFQRPANVPRRCIFDPRYGCIISQPIPTESLGTSFDMQTMANNCGYQGGKDNWWHIHHSAPALHGRLAPSCPHSYKPGQEDQAQPCKCETMEIWQEKIAHAKR